MYQTLRRSLSSLKSAGAAATAEGASSKWAMAAVVTGGALAGYLVASTSVDASEDLLHYPHMTWSHSGIMDSWDTASLRRGFEVYRQVCSTCHNMDFTFYRNLVGVTHTEVQAKALATSIKVQDGPNDKGNMFERPGRLTDRMPRPYANEQAARAANNGAFPPDLSLVSKARHGGEDYVFSILTGYIDPPFGIKIREGLHYNPYFPGGAIAMAKALQDDGITYEDGTPATVTQQAKDVSTFLAWASEPEQDERKLLGIKAVIMAAFMAIGAGYQKRLKWSLYKTQRIHWIR